MNLNPKISMGMQCILSLIKIKSQVMNISSFFKKRKSSLAEELADTTPFAITAISEMIERIRVKCGYEKENKRADNTFIVKINAYKTVEYAMKMGINLYDADIIIGLEDL